MALIFSLSSQNAEVSSGTSGNVIRLIVGIFYPGFDNLPAAEQTEIVASLQFLARKSAHFSIYMILGVLSFLTFISYEKLLFALRLTLSGGICLYMPRAMKFISFSYPAEAAKCATL